MDKPQQRQTGQDMFRLAIKLVRIPAGLFIVFALGLLGYSLVDYGFLSSRPFPLEEILGAAFMLVLGTIFWTVPKWFLGKIDAFTHQPGVTRHTAEASTTYASYQHSETAAHDAQYDNTVIRPDAYGNILFDSTRRPLRVYAGSFGIVLGLLILLLMWLMSDTLGTFEYVFTTGWMGFALLVMGFVYEVRVNPRMGTVNRKIGWFFLTLSHDYRLADYDKVLVVSSFFKSTYNQAQERHQRRAPNFSVDLIGKRRLNLYVFSSLAEARETGRAIADHFGLPLHEYTEVSV